MGGTSRGAASEGCVADHSRRSPHDRLLCSGGIRHGGSFVSGASMQSSSSGADVDSPTAMLRALSNYLKGEDFPLVGAMPRRNLPVMKLVAAAVNRLPNALREQVYIWSGRFEAISPKKLAAVRTDEI